MGSNWGTTAEACYAKVLAGRRLDPTLVAEITASREWGGLMVPAGPEASCGHNRTLVRATHPGALVGGGLVASEGAYYRWPLHRSEKDPLSSVHWVPGTILLPALGVILLPSWPAAMLAIVAAKDAVAR